MLSTSVGPSVRLSVKRDDCYKTKQISADIMIAYEREIHQVFRHEEYLVGTSPSTLNFAASKKAISDRYSLVAFQPLDLAKKVQLSLIESRLRALH